MYNTWSRYALMATFALSALVSLYYNQYQLASIAGFLFAFILWSHFKHSSVLLASKHFKDTNYDKAEEILNEVTNPDRLAKNRRGYYEFMRANIALQREDFEKAEFHFQIASRFPLGGKNDKAFVMIHLANLALRKKDAERAKAYIEKAKELATTSRAKEIIKIIEKEANGLA
jgi:outer membrane protein assembly factor BamD (BamD/ComL family)